MPPPSGCICQTKADAKEPHRFKSPIQSCTELGFYSPKRPQAVCEHGPCLRQFLRSFLRAYPGKERFIMKERPIHGMQKNFPAHFPKRFVGIVFVVPAQVRILSMRIGCDILPVRRYIDVQIQLVKRIGQSWQPKRLQCILQFIVGRFFLAQLFVLRKLIDRQRRSI